ncbi:hypothetical protein [Streptomyces sp. NBC_01235]|uniref:hypothetical protein n=1 Tax=Streptomyces sp. NBC_01235 TaxID=2903788 RepID=UPI002E14560A|nr:hypothetical protein OG289_31485 [Streptomyces sp. NBC_01235]
MGERLNDGARHGRRRARPDDAVVGPPGLEALLAQALSEPGDRPDAGSEGELRAIAAFRDARDAGAHQAVRTRRRDDWRPRARRHTARSLRVTLSALIGGLALGGAAFAAIGSGADGGDGGAARPQQSAAATAGPSGEHSVTPSATDDADRNRPANAEDTEAHCRAYEQVHGRGKAMDATAWQRLVTAAGGEENVAAYCAAFGQSKAEDADRTPQADKSPKAGNSPDAGKTATPGNSAQPEKSAKAENSARPENTRAADGG